jgi:HEAT repeat protein
MSQKRYFVLFALFLLAVPAWAEDKPSEDKQQKPLAVLRSDAPAAEKATACKQLAIYGKKEAVAALAPLLADEKLSSWSRIALEAIPDPAADEALRQALGTLHGRLLIGVINSLGVRHDVHAVEYLAVRLKDSDAEVAAAAAVALGRIGNAAAVKTLEPSLVGTPETVRSAVAIGCILCAEKALSDGNRDEAVRLYDMVRKADVPPQRVREATRGAILARQSAGVPLLVETLKSPDKATFALGLRVARELSGREVTDALLAELNHATPQRQGLLILALADRGDTAVLNAVLEAAKSGSGEARLAAIRVLRRLGNASCVPVLLAAAAEKDEQLSQAAMGVLADMTGKDVDDDLAARLAGAQGDSRRILIQLAGQRQIAAAVPALWKAADDADAQIRAASLTALGYTIALQDLPVLIGRVGSPKNPDDVAPAQKALADACQRMPEPDACAAQLVAAMAQAAVPVKCRFLDVLGKLGGARALQAVAAAAKDADPVVRDAGSKLLGEWMSTDAAPVLLDLARTSTDEKYKIRAVRAYIRLVRQFDMPEAQRAAMCRTAMEIAERDAEKKLVLEVLDRYPSQITLALALEASKVPSLKNDAAAVCLMIEKRIGGKSAEMQKLLRAVGHKPVKLEILTAHYGAGTAQKDVTAILRQNAGDFPMIVLPNPNYNTSFGGDPASGVVKQLKIQYKINGKPGEVALPENDPVVLPVPK